MPNGARHGLSASFLKLAGTAATGKNVGTIKKNSHRDLVGLLVQVRPELTRDCVGEVADLHIPNVPSQYEDGFAALLQRGRDRFTIGLVYKNVVHQRLRGAFAQNDNQARRNPSPSAVRLQRAVICFCACC